MNQSEEKKQYDVIVIGSGIGGMSAAKLMAKWAGKKVLIVEKHFKFGGFTHNFRRPGAGPWDVGVHYIGKMKKGSRPRRIMDYLTDKNVEWEPVAEPVDTFIYPECSFALPRSMRKFSQKLIAMYPEEKKAIKRYIFDVKLAVLWFSLKYIAAASPPKLKAALELAVKLSQRFFLQTTQHYFSRRFQSSQLRALCQSQWGDYGLAPSASAFVMHAVVVAHYAEGAWFPQGGGAQIASAIEQSLKHHEVDILLSTEVSQIVVEGTRARGIIAHKTGNPDATQHYSADCIISAAGLHTTYTRLLPSYEHIPYHGRLATVHTGCSFTVVYLGLNASPASLGLSGGNQWIFNSEDHEKNFQDAEELSKIPSVVYLSFPSLKDPTANNHTAIIISPTSYSLFSAWADKPWKKRGSEYEQLKEKIGDDMIAMVEQNFPGFTKLISYREVSTPLSIETFSSHAGAMPYGMPPTPERFKQKAHGPRTPVQGLYLAGADTTACGVVGAMMGGVQAACVAHSAMGFFKFMRTIYRS